MRTEANTSDPLFYVTRHIGFGDVQGEVFLSQDEAFAKFDEYDGGSDATGVWDAQLTQLKYYGGRDKRRPEEMKEWVTNFNRDEMQAPSSSWALPSRYPAIRALSTATDFRHISTLPPAAALPRQSLPWRPDGPVVCAAAPKPHAPSPRLRNVGAGCGAVLELVGTEGSAKSPHPAWLLPIHRRLR